MKKNLVICLLLSALTLVSGIFAVCSFKATANNAAADTALTEDEQKLETGILDMFSDYANTSIKDEGFDYAPENGQVRHFDFNDIEDLYTLRELIMGHPHYDALCAYIDRARKVLSGEIYFDDTYVFSTREGAANKIDQNGDVRTYARQLGKGNGRDFGGGMRDMARNDQPTGIAARAKATVTIYVNCDDEHADKLPSIRFTQAKMSSMAWIYCSGLGKEKQLQKGENVFEVPDFLAYGVYKDPVPGGGPIYIVNPYTKEEQGEIDIYFSVECFEKFPIFFEGGDEDAYKTALAEYEEKRLADPETVFNLTELVGQHSLMTVSSSCAKRLYVDEGNSPEESQKNWNEYVEDFLRFEGLAFSQEEMDKSSEVDGIHTLIYNEFNKLLRFNGRLVQNRPGAGLYCNEYIGFYEDTEPSVTYCRGMETMGWGMTHEIGHGIDIRTREVPETTNNMVSNYNRVVQAGGSSRQDNDGSLNSDVDNPKIGNYYANGNFQFWWNIESWKQGSYALFENFWRYSYNPQFTEKNPEPANQNNFTMNAEREAYYWSLATGHDMTYYFARWGKGIKDVNSVSDYYKSAIAAAKEKGWIKDFENGEAPKLWYQDPDAYHFFKSVNDGEISASDLYNETYKPKITEVKKSADGNGYIVLLPSPTIPANNHLGYEIHQLIDGEWKVVAFVDSAFYVDTRPHPNGEIPQFKIVAYDRALGKSSISEDAATYIESEVKNVCKIDGKGEYITIAEAVNAAEANDTIVLFADAIELTPVVIDKNLTITVDDGVEKVTVGRYCEGSLITLNSGCTLTIDGKDKLTFDGIGIRRKGSFLLSNGTTYLNNLTFENCASSDYGGAVRSANYGRIYATDCNFVNCSASRGGAAYNPYGSYFEATKCNFKNNTATDSRGGAFYNYATSAKLTDCVFTGNTAANYGGAIGYDGGQGSLTIQGGRFENNSCNNNGGAIWTDSSVNLSGTQFSDNSTRNGLGMHVYFGIYQKSCSMSSVTFVSKDDENSVYLHYGPLTIDKACKIGGYITEGIQVLNGKSLPAQLYVKDGVPDNLAIKVGFDKIGTKILYSNSYNFTAEDLAKIKPIIEKGEILEIAQDKRSIQINVKEVNLLFMFGDQITSETVYAGSEYTFDYVTNANGSQYADTFIVNGKTYTVGNTFEIPERGATVTCQAKNSKKITINVNGTQYVYYCIPNKTFEMPYVELKDGFIKNFVGEDGETTYNVGEEITVSSDITLTATVEDYVILTFRLVSYEYRIKAVKGKKIYLPMELDGLDRDVAYYTVLTDGRAAGKRYRSRDLYVASENTVFDLTLMAQVTIHYNDELTEVFAVRPHTEYQFRGKIVGDEYAYKFVDDDGVEYRYGNYAIISEDREFTAEYQLAYTVTFTVSDGENTVVSTKKVLPGESFIVPTLLELFPQTQSEDESNPDLKSGYDPETGIVYDDSEFDVDNPTQHKILLRLMPKAEGAVDWKCGNQAYHSKKGTQRTEVTPSSDMEFEISERATFVEYDGSGFYRQPHGVFGTDMFLHSDTTSTFGTNGEPDPTSKVVLYLEDTKTKEKFLPGDVLPAIKGRTLLCATKLKSELTEDDGVLFTIRFTAYGDRGNTVARRAISVLRQPGTIYTLPANLYPVGPDVKVTLWTDEKGNTYLPGEQVTVSSDLILTATTEYVMLFYNSAAEVEKSIFNQKINPVPTVQNVGDEISGEANIAYNQFRIPEVSLVDDDGNVLGVYNQFYRCSSKSSVDTTKIYKAGDILTTEPGKENSITGDMTFKAVELVNYVEITYVYGSNEQAERYRLGAEIKLPDRNLDRNQYLTGYFLESTEGARYEIGDTYTVEKSVSFYGIIEKKTAIDGYEDFRECETEGELEYNGELNFSFKTYQSRDETRKQIIEAENLLPKTVTVHYSDDKANEREALTQEVALTWSVGDLWLSGDDCGAATAGEYKFLAKPAALPHNYADKQLVAFVQVTDDRAEVVSLVNDDLRIAIDEMSDPVSALPTEVDANISDGSTASIPLVWSYNGERSGIQTVSAEAGGEYKLSPELKITAEVLFKSAGTEGFYAETQGSNLPFDAAVMPEGYTLIGWASPSGKFEKRGSEAAESGWYAAVCVKFELYGSIRYGMKTPGSRYGFKISVLNDERVIGLMDNVSMNVKLTAQINGKSMYMNVPGEFYLYEQGKVGFNGEITCNAVVTGFTEENADTWKNVKISAQMQFTVFDETWTYTGDAMSANDIAVALIEGAENDAIKDAYLEAFKLYLNEDDYNL